MTEINILCLHGCCQNIDIFKNLLRDYIKLSPEMNWHFLEGKYDHSRCGKTWFQPELSLDKIGQDMIELDEIKNILTNIDEYIELHKINVLLGFSQGGNVIDCYLRLYPETKIKCAVIGSGYSFPSLVKHNNDIQIPILYLSSEIDDIVLFKNKPLYMNEKIIMHDKGHKVPTRKVIIKQVIDFIQNYK